MTLYCKTTSYPGFCITVTCYYSSALERVINVNLSVCNLVPRSSLFVTSVWDSVCFLLCCRWVMRSFACASKASLWTGSLRATCYPASKTSVTVSSAACLGRKSTSMPHSFTTSRRNLTCVGTQTSGKVLKKKVFHFKYCNTVPHAVIASGILQKAGSWTKQAFLWWLMLSFRGSETCLRWFYFLTHTCRP